ncbi:hypothetical protein CO709_13620 [Burkholderia thailandensis]|nr:hypothetical protein CO709_13620 [Burkholderia thailandensis]
MSFFLTRQYPFRRVDEIKNKTSTPPLQPRWTGISRPFRCDMHPLRQLDIHDWCNRPSPENKLQQNISS